MFRGKAWILGASLRPVKPPTQTRPDSPEIAGVRAAVTRSTVLPADRAHWFHQRSLTDAAPRATIAAMPLPEGLLVRGLREHDSMESLTALLHRAYAPHAAVGLAFMATHQDVATTRRRTAQGTTTVATLRGDLVATITLVPPGRTSGCDWYDRPDVAVITQLAVEPALQRCGLGTMLIDRCARAAADLGALELALDTSEHAAELIALYGRLGFRHVGHADWRPSVNYRSVVLSRRLATNTSG